MAGPDSALIRQGASPLSLHYVIVGNGVAGMEAALALRGRDDEARISIVSAEHDHFFSRKLWGRGRINAAVEANMRYARER